MKQILASLSILLAIILFGCHDVPTVADKDSTIVLASNRSFLRTGGDTAQITVTGYSGNGEPIRDGTLVTFTTSLGSLPPSVELRDGRAIVTFVSGNQRGEANIKARSGIAVGELSIDIEYSTQAKITLKATPTSLPAAGGPVTIKAEVADNKGNPFTHIPVSFETTTGTFEKPQNPIYTDDYQGIAINVLRTKATADVTVSSLGQSATITIEVSENTPPTASFTYWPLSPKVGDQVNFDASASTDTDGKIVQYSWSFNDGYKDGGCKIHRSCSTSGEYEVSLQVKDNLGAVSAVVTKTFSVVENEAPVASFDFFPTNPTVNADIRFDASSSTDSDGWIKKWEWDFGDGEHRSGEIVTHSYDHAGTFQIHLTVTDNDGQTDETAQTVTVGVNQAPIASYTYFKSTDGQPLKYDFDAGSSYDSDGYIVSYAWDFGDGSAPLTISTTTVTHIFPEKKTYKIRLVVTDNLGSKGEVLKDVVVE